MTKIYTPRYNEELIELVNNENIKLSEINISEIFDLSNAFKDSLRKDFSGIEDWDVSHVTKIDNMFSNAHFFDADLSKWNLENVPRENKCFDFLLRYVFDGTPVVQDLDNYQVDILDRSLFQCKLPIKSDVRYLCKHSCKPEDLDYLCKDPNLELYEIDPSCCTDFSNVLKDAERKDYNGLEEWITSNVKSFKNFAANAQNFKYANVDFFDLSKAVTLEGFLENTEYNRKFNLKVPSFCRSMRNFCANCYCYNQDIDFLKDFNNQNCDFSGMFVGCRDLQKHLSAVADNPRLRDAISVSLLINNLNDREDLVYLSEDSEVLYDVLTDDLNNHLHFRTSLDNKNVLVLKNKSDDHLLLNYLKYNQHNGFFALELLPIGSDKLDFKANTTGAYSCFLTNNTQTAKFLNYMESQCQNYLEHVIPLKATDYIALKCFSIDHKIDFNFMAFQMLSYANNNFGKPETLISTFNRTYENSIAKGDETTIYLSEVINKLAENGIIKADSLISQNKLEYNHDKKLIPTLTR